MEALTVVGELAKRQFGTRCQSGYYRSGNRCYPRSSWYWWGRWVLAGVLVIVVIVSLVLIGCVNARRRRKRGLNPMYGTGWMANQNKQGQAYPQNGGQNAYGQGYQAPPPAYGQPPVQNQYTGTTFNPNDGYYGGHNEGIQLQQPQNAYQRDVYSPPTGPPPGK